MACPKLGEMSTDLQTAVNCLWGNLYLQLLLGFSAPLSASSRSLDKILSFNAQFSPFVSRVSDATIDGFYPYSYNDTIPMQLYQYRWYSKNAVSTGSSVRTDEPQYSTSLHEGADASAYVQDGTENEYYLCYGPH